MIIGFFLSLFYTFISFIVGLLPTSAFPSEISSAITTFWSYVNLFSMVVPVQTIITVLGLSFTYLATLLVWDAFHWVLRRIRR